MSNAPRNIDIERLDEAVTTLRPLERQALILGAEGLRNDEIAERLGIDPRHAERLLAKALRKLDRALERRRRPWWKVW